MKELTVWKKIELQVRHEALYIGKYLNTYSEPWSFGLLMISESQTDYMLSLFCRELNDSYEVNIHELY